MYVRVSVGLPNRPKGDLVEVHEVGLVENYGSVDVELSEEQVELINSESSYGLSAVE